MISAAREYAAVLHRSFAASFRLLEQPKVARCAVAVLLGIQTGLLAYSAYVHSPTLNEPAHLVAGLSNWTLRRFDIYRVNPPLARMAASIPVLIAGYEEDWSNFYCGPRARPEFKMGEDFINANGQRSYFLIMIARLACIPFSWIGGTVCYLWARDLYGRPAGVCACALWCLEPNMLAHGALITPDAHATSLGVAACYTFWRWLRFPSWRQAIVTGVVLGVAELAKTTLILLYPLWPVIWIAYRLSQRKLMTITNWLCEGAMLALRMALGIYILNFGYGFDQTLRPLGEFRFVSNLFTGDSTTDSTDSSPESANDSPILLVNRFANSWVDSVPMPLPADYLLGIDLQQCDFEDYGHLSYLRGQWRDHGWWWYYLYASAIKVPIGLWILGIACAFQQLFVIANPRGQPSTLHIRDTIVLLSFPVFIFAIVSSKTGFSEHMRYILPCFPFAFIFSSGIFTRYFDTQECIAERSFAQSRLRCSCWPIAFPILLLWFATSSLWIYPHCLSYFNETIGGPNNGANHLLGSNLDWGQDLRYIQRHVQGIRARGDNSQVHLAYFGVFEPAAVGFREAYPSIGRRAPVSDTESTMTIPSGWYFISQNALHEQQFAFRGGAPLSGGPCPLSLTSLKAQAERQSCGYANAVFYVAPSHPVF